MMPDFDVTHPILAIDTATANLSLALSTPNGIITYDAELANKQAEHILPAIAQLLGEAQLQVSDLSAIVVNQGPGSFTGLRIGIGIAQGLAAPFDLPIVPIPSLDVLASLAHTKTPESHYILAAIDARRNEVFYAWYDANNQHRISEYSVGPIREITPPESVDLTRCMGLGNAYALPDMGDFLTGLNTMPSAPDLIHLAQTQTYTALAARDVQLLYVRNNIALTLQEQDRLKNPL